MIITSKIFSKLVGSDYMYTMYFGAIMYAQERLLVLHGNSPKRFFFFFLREDHTIRMRIS